MAKHPATDNDTLADSSAESRRVARGDERLELRIEVGRARMRIDEARNLRSGSVAPLDDLVDDPVSIYAGRRLVARGELLEYDGKVAVRLLEVMDGQKTSAEDDRLRSQQNPGRPTGGQNARRKTSRRRSASMWISTIKCARVC